MPLSNLLETPMNGPPTRPTWRKATLLVHGLPQRHPHGATLPPVTLSTAFEHASAEEMEAVFAHRQESFSYSRLGNPTVAALEERVTWISRARGTVAVASGMSAVAMALLALVRSGDHIVAGKHVFGGTYTLLDTTLNRLGISTTWADVWDGREVNRALRPETRAVFVEAIANPAMTIPDFDAIRTACASRRIALIVDATLLTPLLFDPETTGADVAVYSGSKFLAGAATTVGGLIVDTGRFDWVHDGPDTLGDFRQTGAQAYLSRIRQELMVGIGPCLSPQAAFLQIIGLETLELRMERQRSSAQRVAEWLEQHPSVRSVAYPGLPSHKHHNRCTRYFDGNASCVLSFALQSRDACFRFLNRLQLVRRASNLGDTQSLALHPASTIYQAFWPAQRDELGASETLIRLSVGIEDVEDILADLAAALLESP